MIGTYQADSCSVFCGRPDFDIARTAFEERVTGTQVDFREPHLCLRGHCGAHDIKLASMPWEGPGKELARTILGALTYVRRIQTVHDDRKRELLAALTNCRLLLGVTGSDAFLSDSSCQDMIRVVASRTEGVLFDGADFYNAEGVLLLSHDGRSELA